MPNACVTLLIIAKLGLYQDLKRLTISDESEMKAFEAGGVGPLSLAHPSVMHRRG
jgi:hypothetical protein